GCSRTSWGSLLLRAILRSRQANHELGAASRRRADLDVPSESLERLPAESEAETVALSAALPARLRLIKPVEDERAVPRRDSGPLVRDRDLRSAFLEPGAGDGDPSAERAELHGVVEEVLQDAPEKLLVGEHGAVLVGGGLELKLLLRHARGEAFRLA